MKPLVIIPTYNERDNLASLLPAVLQIDPRIHVLIVDDGSPDGTGDYVVSIQSQWNGRLHLERRSGKLGLGTAYVHGFRWGLKRAYDFLIEMDADWSHSPKYLRNMLDLGGKNDFVIGSRYMPGGGTVNWGLGRLLLSRWGSFYSRVILGVNLKDFTGGFNGWNAEVLHAISPETVLSDGYSFQIELKYRASKLGFRCIEFPIIFEERRAGQSKMSGDIVVEAAWRVWQLRFKNQRFLSRHAEQIASSKKKS